MKRLVSSCPHFCIHEEVGSVPFLILRAAYCLYGESTCLRSEETRRFRNNVEIGSYWSVYSWKLVVSYNIPILVYSWTYQHFVIIISIVPETDKCSSRVVDVQSKLSCHRRMSSGCAGRNRSRIASRRPVVSFVVYCKLLVLFNVCQAYRSTWSHGQRPLIRIRLRNVLVSIERSDVWVIPNGTGCSWH